MLQMAGLFPLWWCWCQSQGKQIFVTNSNEFHFDVMLSGNKFGFSNLLSAAAVVKGNNSKSCFTLSLKTCWCSSSESSNTSALPGWLSCSLLLCAFLNSHWISCNVLHFCQSLYTNGKKIPTARLKGRVTEVCPGEDCSLLMFFRNSKREKFQILLRRTRKQIYTIIKWRNQCPGFKLQ